MDVYSEHFLERNGMDRIHRDYDSALEDDVFGECELKRYSLQVLYTHLKRQLIASILNANMQ